VILAAAPPAPPSRCDPAVAGGGAALWRRFLHHGRRHRGFCLGHVADLADLRRRALASLPPHAQRLLRRSADGESAPAFSMTRERASVHERHADARQLPRRPQFHRNTKDFRRLLTLLQRNRTRRTKPKSKIDQARPATTVRSLRVKTHAQSRAFV